MMTSRIYHSLHLDLSDNGSDKIVYVLLPKELEEKDKETMDLLAAEKKVNLVCIDGYAWADAMTPWQAKDVFKKNRTYGGDAEHFLEELDKDLMFNIEHSIRMEKAERYLVGTSLSGLFAVWSTVRKPLFKGVASISGSFWYEGFKEWFLEKVDFHCDRYFFSLGEKEKDSRNSLLATVQDATEEICNHLEQSGKEVSFQLDGYDHFSHLCEKVSAALDFLIV